MVHFLSINFFSLLVFSLPHNTKCLTKAATVSFASSNGLTNRDTGRCFASTQQIWRVVNAYCEGTMTKHCWQTHQYCQVSLWRPTDHVGDKAFVARGIQDSKVLFFSLKVGSPDFHGLPLVPLLLVGVQCPRQVPVEEKHAKMLRNLLKGFLWFSFP